MNKLEKLLATTEISLLEALEKINQNEKGILFILNEDKKIVGSVSDGDIRRGLINKKVLEIKISDIMNKKPFSCSSRMSVEEILAKIKAKKLSESVDISIVPLLDENNEIVDYFEHNASFHAPIASPVLDGNEMAYIHECIHTNWISSQGRFVNEFEAIFSKEYSVDFSVSVMNGTAALHLALLALGITNGDEVIVPSLTFAASINAILYTGATPVIVDVEKDSWCIDPREIEKHITPKTKAIMPVHIYGQVCEMDQILSIAKKNKLFVVEDCAEAQGAKYKDKYVGTIGDVGCFSFFGNKIITTGEGGMCTTHDPELNKKMRKLRDHGMSRDHRLYYHDVVGYNYRMTNLQAAIGLAQMERIKEIQSARVEIENKYHRALSCLENFVPQSNLQNRQKTIWLVSYLNKSKKLGTPDLIQKLKSLRIDVRPFFYPLHLMEIYQEFAKSPCPISEELSLEGINLPTSLSITDKDYQNIFGKIIQTLE